MFNATESLLALIDRAEAALTAAKEDDDLGRMKAGVDAALEAARRLRAEVDVHGTVALKALLRMESLFRAAVRLQPGLAEVEEREVEALIGGDAGANERGENVALLREQASVLAQALLGSLEAGYRLIGKAGGAS